MTRCIMLVCLLCLGLFCARASEEVLLQRKAKAERYFRGVYGGDSSVLDQLAAEDVVITYPIFEQLYGKGAIRGREAAKAFSAHFSAKWADPELTISESIAQKDAVALVWTITARDAKSMEESRATWGGITVLHFDSEGKIVAEIGEESAPGPMDRMNDASGNEEGRIKKHTEPADGREGGRPAPVDRSSVTEIHSG